MTIEEQALELRRAAKAFRGAPTWNRIAEHAKLNRSARAMGLSPRAALALTAGLRDLERNAIRTRSRAEARIEAASRADPGLSQDDPEFFTFPKLRRKLRRSR